MTYELRFDDYAVEHRLYYVQFRGEDKYGVPVNVFDRNYDGDIVAVNYKCFVVRIAKGLKNDGGDAEYDEVREHTELWEVHEQYKRRIW